ncbi:hypothetical protein [Streptomyces sp. 147326]|uniref:hypothetical protein n=1 Tax=Streptomyces sp. 147326 TaxID=3074379 RepID=UPI003857D207
MMMEPGHPTEDEDGIPFGREEELVQALVDLRTMIADAPEEGGGPNWDKHGALTAIEQVHLNPNR